MHVMQQQCGLIHADLSEYNMLWHRDRVYVIDVSQTVDQMHPKAMEFLYRDCYNVSKVRRIHEISEHLFLPLVNHRLNYPATAT